MLPRRFRLARNRDITHVWKRGATAVSAYARIKFLPSPTGGPRVAVVVSLHVSKKAVERNQVKRRMHVLLAALLPRIAPVDFVLTMQPRARATSLLALRQDIQPLLARTHILRSPA